MSSQFKEFWNEFTREHSRNTFSKEAAKEAWNSALDKFVEETTSKPNKSNLTQTHIDIINKIRNDE